jgi:hypothetical protein
LDKFIFFAKNHRFEPINTLGAFRSIFLGINKNKIGEKISIKNALK